MVTSPAVAPARLTAPAKVATMTPDRVTAYNDALAAWAAWAAGWEGGGGRSPVALVDAHAVTTACGPPCTTDGIHYDEAVYDVVAAAWLRGVVEGGG